MTEDECKTIHIVEHYAELRDFELKVREDTLKFLKEKIDAELGYWSHRNADWTGREIRLEEVKEIIDRIFAEMMKLEGEKNVNT